MAYSYQAGRADKMPCWLKILFSMPRYVIRSVYTFFSVYIVSYYIGLGAELSHIAFFIAVGRSFDTLTDPFMGWLTDSTRSRWGRRKPYLVLGPVLYGTAVVLQVVPPPSLYAKEEGQDGTGLALWFGITYLTFFLCDTLCSVPYYAMKYEMTTDEAERNRIFSFTVFASFIGLVVTIGLPSGLERVFGTAPGLSIVITVVHLVVIYTIGMWGSCLFIREPVERSERPGFAATFTRVISTRAMQLLTASYCLDFGSLYTLAAILPFYVQYHIITPNEQAQDYRVCLPFDLTPHARLGELSLMPHVCRTHSSTRG
jgi:Na+/melibiose symporter-like transporter